MHIAILTGGLSTEREIALKSVKNLNNWITKSGHTTDIFDIPDGIDHFLQSYQKYNLAIPVLHGKYGEDGIVSGLCETIGLPVAGCPSGVHALCIDKFRTNTILEKIGINIPKSWIPGLPIPHFLPTKDTPKIAKSLIIKPNQGGSSVATTKARNFAEFQDGLLAVENNIKTLAENQKKIITNNISGGFMRKFPSFADIPLVQECIEGREFTVGVYREGGNLHILPIIEIKTLAEDFFDYREKYETDGSNEVFSEIEPKLQSELENTTKKIYDFLGCGGIVRIDYRYDGENLYFLEVNTIPGFSEASLIPKMWKKAGKSEEDFVRMLIEK